MLNLIERVMNNLTGVELMLMTFREGYRAETRRGHKARERSVQMFQEMSRQPRSRTWWCVPQASVCLRWVNVKAQTYWEYVKTAAALSSQHVKSRAAEVEKVHSIQQKSMHRKSASSLAPPDFCAAARANFTLRTVRPALVEEFAASHNHARHVW